MQLRRLGSGLIAGLLRLERGLRRFRLSSLTTLLEFVAHLFCPVELDFLNLTIYWQGGTAVAAESHFPIHVDFKPRATAWAGKVDDLHENPFRITSTNASRKTGIISAAASSRFAMLTILSTRLMNVPTIVQVRKSHYFESPYISTGFVYMAQMGSAKSTDLGNRRQN